MLIIQIRENPKNEKSYVVVNGIVDEESHFIAGQKYVELFNQQAINALFEYSINEIRPFLSHVEIPEAFQLHHCHVTLEITAAKGYQSEFFFQAETDIEHWAKPYSVLAFLQRIKKKAADLHITHFPHYGDSFDEGFTLEFPINNLKIPIRIFYENLKAIFIQLIETTAYELLQESNKHSIMKYFEFPDHIKTACQQYLLYFTQFLSDLGITCKSEIIEETHKTLFKITPANKNESLSRIREALTIYLATPAIQDIENSLSPHDNISILQWKANIVHLKNQLTFANATLQMKDATIQALHLTNYQYQQQLTNSQTIKPADKEEDLIKDILSLKKYESSGFSINLAEIFRRLKRKFKKRP